MAKIENRERKPRRRGLHVARGDFSCSASQNHRAFICCTSFPNRACSVGLRSADCRCQPGYCTAACMKNCAPDGAQFLNIRISSALLVLLQQHGHALGARSAAEDEHRAERLQRLHYSQSGVSRMIAARWAWCSRATARGFFAVRAGAVRGVCTPFGGGGRAARPGAYFGRDAPVPALSGPAECAGSPRRLHGI